MSTKLQYMRITKQVRISERLHRKLKLAAAEQGITMSRIADEAIEEFLRKGKGEEIVPLPEERVPDERLETIQID